MIIKRYIVSNMNEAMTKIRYELGSDAVIISQRRIKKPGIKGFFSSKVLEVTAAVDKEKKNDDKEDSVEKSLEAIRKIALSDEFNGKVNKKEEEKYKENKENIKGNSLEEEMREMKTLLQAMAKNNMPKENHEHISFLRELDFYEEDIALIKSLLQEKEETRENIRNVILELVDIKPMEDEGVIVLVGPTGVGKTTTIAKLAGKLALIDKKKVGLITIDTYRIGAVEQLKTYSEIMNVEFKVVITLKDMEEAIKSLSHCDVILVDTTGRSSKNTMQISELRAFIEKTKPSSINLVISSTVKNKDVENIVEGYRSLDYEGVIITKLDETTTYGTLLNILNRSKTPLRAITTGQSVPDDIKTPDREEILDLILGESNIC